MSASPVELLLREHALTRRVLAVLDRIAARLELGHTLPAADIARALTYFRDFLGQVHHAKEVPYCFSAITLLGRDELTGVVGGLMADYDETKILLHTLALFWEPGELREDERPVFAGMARTYTHRMRRHMKLEERVLFPALVAPQLDEGAVLEAFERVGRGHRDLASWKIEVEGLESRH